MSLPARTDEPFILSPASNSPLHSMITELQYLRGQIKHLAEREKELSNLVKDQSMRCAPNTEDIIIATASSRLRLHYRHTDGFSKTLLMDQFPEIYDKCRRAGQGYWRLEVMK